MVDQIFEKVVPSPSYDEKNNPWIINRRTSIWGRLEQGQNQEKLFGNAGLSEYGDAEYSDVIEYHGKLFFVPGSQIGCPVIRIYDCQTNNVDEVELRALPIRRIKRRDALFIKAIQTKGYIFFVGSSYPAIVRLNASTYEVDYISEWNSAVDVSEREDAVMGFFSGMQSVVKDDYIFLACSLTSGVLRIDVNTLEEKYYPIKSDAEGLFSLAEYDKECFLISCLGKNSNKVILWDYKNDVIKKNIALETEESIYPISYMLVSEKRDVYLFPSGALYNGEWPLMDIYCMDGKSFELRPLKLVQNIISRERGEAILGSIVAYATWRTKDTIVFVSGIDGEWFEYNVEKNVCEKKDVRVENKDAVESRMEYYGDLLKQGILVKENDLALPDFLDVLAII